MHKLKEASPCANGAYIDANAPSCSLTGAESGNIRIEKYTVFSAFGLKR